MDDERREIDVLKAELADARARLAALEAKDAGERSRFEEALEVEQTRITARFSTRR